MACRGDTPFLGGAWWEGCRQHRAPRSRYRHVQMEGVPTRTRYIRPMKLRPTLHDARVDRGGPVRALSSPAAHLPKRPHTPSVHASLGNQFRFVSIQHAPPCPTPNPHHQKNVMHQTLTQSRGRDNGRLAWLAMPCTGTGTRARARAGGHGQLRCCWCCSLQEHDGWCESARCLIAHQTHHSDAAAISQTWDETNIWPFLTAQTPLASRHHTLDGKESSTPCHTDLLLLQDTAMGSSRLSTPHCGSGRGHGWGAEDLAS